MKLSTPHIKLTPFILASIAKSYFKLQKNLPKHQYIFLKKWITQCKKTSFWSAHNFSSINTIQDFQRLVPISHYDTMRPWIEQAMKGYKNMLTPGYIEWFATSSGTTGASKYIPVTIKSLKANHYKAWTAGIMYYALANPHSTTFMGQNITIGGTFGVNPYTGEKNVGFISAIFQKNSPLRTKMMKQPKAKVSYMPDREPKVAKMIDITTKKNITSIAGQPSRCSQFLLKVLEKTGKQNILDVRPNFQMVLRWGMALDLYKETFAKLLPTQSIQYYQIYNASEGFFAMQHQNNRDDMLLFLNHGVFYEFIPLENYLQKNYSVALPIDDVQIGVEYVIVVTTQAGLRRYVLGDTIVFTGIKPHTMKITGRTKYYIDIVWECMPLSEIEKALMKTATKHGITIQEYTVWPHIEPAGKKCYECIIATSKNPHDISAFTKDLDESLCDFRAYKDERVDTSMISTPMIHFVSADVFYNWLERKGKLGWQHKVPKISNDRALLDELLAISS
jgi:phenylacetate-coenzyme A ligase PaaK-like adenylate-forming protein